MNSSNRSSSPESVRTDLAERCAQQRGELGTHWRALETQASQADRVVNAIGTIGKAAMFLPGVTGFLFKTAFLLFRRR